MRDEHVDEREVKGLKAYIYMDECASDPRGDDNLGTMICFHRRYGLGDKHQFSSPEEFMEWWKEEGKGGVILPLFLMDHSGISMSTSSYHDKWDSGQVGFIYILAEKIRKEYSIKRLTDKVREKVTAYLTSEVNIYSDYISGEVYGYKLVDPATDEELDSCWGFYGHDEKYMWQTIEEQAAYFRFTLDEEAAWEEHERRRNEQLVLPFEEEVA